MITAVPGVLVGHWTGDGTGVTVIVMPDGSIGSCEVRGGAPATRETALLEPGRTIERVDAVVLSGGSAFGLATADGVMRALANEGRGFPTRGGPVPIVPAAAIFDLADAHCAAPGPDEGRAAVDDAMYRGPGAPFPLGRVGAGTGTTIGKWRGTAHAVPGGLGTAHATDGDIVIGALAVVNAVGDVIAADGTVISGSTAPPGTPPFPPLPPGEFGDGDGQGQAGEGGEGGVSELRPFEHTTLVVLVTNATCTKAECKLLAESAHHGMVRSIHPSHTRHDGDVAFAVSTGGLGGVNLDRLRVLATDVTAEAVRSAVT